MPHQLLFVEASPDPSFGGSKRVLVNVLSALDRDRYSPAVVFARPGPFVDAVRDLGIEATIEPRLLPASRRRLEERNPAADTLRQRIGVRRRDDGDVERNGAREVLRGARSQVHYHLRDRRRAAGILGTVPPKVDLIHVNSPMHEQYTWSHIAKMRGVPFVTHEHGIWRRPPAAFRRIASDAQAVLCLTEDRIGLVRQFCGPSVRTELLPNGIDANRFRPARSPSEVREELGIPNGCALLMTAGHIQRWKGQNLAVEAAHRLDSLGLDFVWVLCGRILEQDFAAELEAAIHGYQLTRRVRLLGERHDLPDLYAATDVCAHTSVQPEPFGMVLIEAMAVGTAVVGPSEGAVPSILAGGQAGRLYKPRSATDLTRTLQEMLQNEPLRQRLAAAGRERVMREFTLESQVRRLECLYDTILAR